ncbi:MAG: tryptophan synthase subunit beta [Acidobacteriota bacterium]
MSSTGRFGRFGGAYVPETLVAPLEELAAAYEEARRDAAWTATVDDALASFVGRPTPLSHAARLSAEIGGARIYLKREDLAHTGAHKINNTVGQVLLARRMEKPRVIAETGAGQHGVATAAAAARYGLACTVYMGSRDMERQALNVRRMRLMGAEVRPVATGSQTLKDAINEALRDWAATVRTTHYVLGSVLGPHPFPTIVRDFQSVIGREARAQCLGTIGRLPDVVCACVGGGSNAIGIFGAFLDDASVDLVGIEAGGAALEPGQHAARFAPGAGGSPGVLHGTETFVLQDDDGQILPTHSISAGLDYPAVGPEHAMLRNEGRTRYDVVDDDAALDAFHALCRAEGILPAMESAHAVAWARREAARAGGEKVILVNLSGRGDKDLDLVPDR